MAAVSPIYAHTLPGEPPDRWELLATHAAAVADLAGRFADALAAADWGRTAGAWHDLGKVQPAFQDYLHQRQPAGPPHAWTGAVFAATHGRGAYPLAFAIAGHHTGLSDLRTDATLPFVGGPTPLADLVQNYKAELAALRPLLPAADAGRTPPPLPPRLLTAHPDTLLQWDLFTRFLFSALVDADRVQTARFMPAISRP